MVNALCGKRIMHTGVCRTTLDVHYIGCRNVFGFPPERFHSAELMSDDGVEYGIIDLPGVADSENKGNERNFNDLTEAWIEKCNIFCWVSDVQTAFLTTHEKAEFDKLQTILKKSSTETGTLYQTFVVLSKYNYTDGVPSRKATGKAKSKVDANGEIQDDEEDSTVSDCWQRVRGVLGAKTPIVKFNAFGRIMHHKGTSDTLRKAVERLGLSTASQNVNTELNLAWVLQDLAPRQEYCALMSWIDHHLRRLMTTSFDEKKLNNGFRPEVRSLSKSYDMSVPAKRGFC